MISDHLEPEKPFMSSKAIEEARGKVNRFYKKMVEKQGYWVFKTQPICPKCGHEIEP